MSGSTDLAGLSGSYFPSSARVTGLEALGIGDELLVAFDIPTDVTPTAGPATLIPGQIALVDRGTGNWQLYEDLGTAGTPGWPISSEIDGLSLGGNPGELTGPIVLGKSGTEATITCPGNCSTGGALYGVYVGTIASLRTGVYDHAATGCADACPGALAVPHADDSYILLVPHNGSEEGSYGRASDGTERPRGAGICVPYQVLGAVCP